MIDGPTKFVLALLIGLLVLCLLIYAADVLGCSPSPVPERAPVQPPDPPVAGDAFAAIPLGRPGAPAAVRRYTQAALLAAIRQVESGGDDRAVGDGGRSRGPLQISRAYWTDAGFGPETWDSGSHQWTTSATAARNYWRRYAPEPARRLAEGRADEKDIEVLARLHNGGPRGMSKQATVAYWNKVKKEIE